MINNNANKILLLIAILTVISFVLITKLQSGKSGVNQIPASQQTINNAPFVFKPAVAQVKDFSSQQQPTFSIKTTASKEDIQGRIAVYDNNGQKVNIPIDVQTNGENKSVVISPTNSFVPGKYKVVLNTDNQQKIEQDFTWGVLAINPNKSVYSPREMAKLALAVLDEKGKMVCDANVTLEIKDPSGQSTTASTQNGTIAINPECKQKKFTVNPDFEASYQVGDAGTYQMSLTAVTANGTYTIVDYFTVESNIEFDVERITATRIFPYDAYPVSIRIIAQKDFTGQIRETVTDTFTVTPLANVVRYSDIQKNGGVQSILWDVAIKKGETIDIGYVFKAPLISPQFYLLGPLSFVSGDTSVFKEKRAWQLAIDAITYSSTVLADNPVAYWRLGESAGTNANDEVGTYDGTYTGSPTLGATGVVTGDSNTAVTFVDTGDQRVTLPQPTVLPSGNADRSVEFWFKMSDTSGQSPAFFGYGYATDTNQFVILFNYLGSNTFDISTYGVGGWDAAMTGSLPDVLDGQPHHVVVTYTGSTKTAECWVDGVDQGDHTFPGNLATDTGAGTLGAMNGLYYYGDDGFRVNGTLDEVAVYDTVLTSTQIIAHYNDALAENPTPTPTPTPGTGNFRFNGVKFNGVKIN